MTDAADTARPILFHALLRPHRSMSPTGFRVLMGVLVVAFFSLGLGFFLVGAWPVIGFCGFEVLLIWWCFKLNFRSLRRYETLLLTDDALELRRVQPDGTVERIAFQPYWLRLRLDEAPGRSSRLVLSSHGREISVGGFLAPDERVDLARALEQALRRQRGPAGAAG
jgi:uncharacterized membrane protein